METLIVLALVVVGLFALVTRSNNRKRQQERESLQAVTTVAEEDVTRLGEDVALLDTETAGRQLDEATRQDYRRALDAYDSAKAALDRVRAPEDVRGITGILEDGRYAVACVKARLAGEPLPARGRRASSTRSTGPRRRTSTGPRPAASSAPCPPARPTQSGSGRAPSPTSARYRWVPAGSRTGRAGRGTARTPRATSPRTPAPGCCPACCSAP
jgi:hypothetical protein